MKNRVGDADSVDFSLAFEHGDMPGEPCTHTHAITGQLCNTVGSGEDNSWVYQCASAEPFITIQAHQGDGDGRQLTVLVLAPDHFVFGFGAFSFELFRGFSHFGTPGESEQTVDVDNDDEWGTT